MRSYTLPCSVRFFLRPLGLSMRLCSGAPSMALTFKGRTGGSTVNCMFCPPPVTPVPEHEPIQPDALSEASAASPQAVAPGRPFARPRGAARPVAQARRPPSEPDLRRSQTTDQRRSDAPSPCAHTLSPHALATAQFGALWPTAYSALPPNSLPLPVRYPPVVS